VRHGPVPASPTCRGPAFSASHNCLNPQRAVVQEDPSTIEVATIVGTVPDAAENCALVGRIASILVTTDAPVDGREVLQLEASEALPDGS
jgi:hypothetical protein